ncbi:MAG: endonuclease [Bacteroidales bacterium]|jgi:endonuclease I|nr:endonuclease [Bacteroidales bacterium]
MIRNYIRTIYISCLFISVPIAALFAQIPAGYYNNAFYKSEYALKTAIHQIIKQNHQQSSYSDLWDHFQSTDRRPDGKVWDMYSECDFIFKTNQCGNYKAECDCYNREHSFPKSWFNDAQPMYTDLFHLYPTDGWVNGIRENLPFGETNGTSYGSGKRGPCTFPGYSGTVFEPADEYKGDFARTYFYIATRYQDQISNWNAEILSGNNTSVFTQWTTNLLLKWHEQDPVSQKEIERNDAVYRIQNNRNPFIDYPELADLIWGAKFGEPFLPDGAIIFGATSICEESVHVYRAEKGKSNYLWNAQNGRIEGSAALDSVTVRWERSGTGNLYVEYEEQNGEQMSAELIVEIKQRPNATITGADQVLMNTEGYLYSTETNMTDYVWSFTGNVSLSEGGGGDDHTAILDFGEKGTATVSVNYTQNGCDALQPSLLEVKIVSTLGMENMMNWQKSITISPNPAAHFTNISFGNLFTGNIQIFNIFKQMINNITIYNSTSHIVDISSYGNGLFIFKITPENDSVIYKKIMVIK